MGSNIADVKSFKRRIHKLELSGAYDGIYDMLCAAVQHDSIDDTVYCFLVAEVVNILQLIESPYPVCESLIGKYDQYFMLLKGLVIRADEKLRQSRCVDWYFCYFLHNWPRYHYFATIYGGSDIVESRFNDLYSQCCKEYGDSIIFMMLPELNGNTADVQQCGDAFVDRICDELREFAFENVYGDCEIMEPFEMYLCRNLKDRLICHESVMRTEG